MSLTDALGSTSTRLRQAYPTRSEVIPAGQGKTLRLFLGFNQYLVDFLVQFKDPESRLLARFIQMATDDQVFQSRQATRRNNLSMERTKIFPRRLLIAPVLCHSLKMRLVV